MTAIAELAALKDTLLANSERTEAAVDVMATSELICQRLASAADSTYEALEAGNNLLALREELVERASDVTTANTALDAWSTFATRWTANSQVSRLPTNALLTY